MYQKNPEFACDKCHKSFKNQRALDAHNESKHSEESISDLINQNRFIEADQRIEDLDE